VFCIIVSYRNWLTDLFITYILRCVPSRRWGTRCRVEICRRWKEDKRGWQRHSAWLESPTSATLCPD